MLINNISWPRSDKSTCACLTERMKIGGWWFNIYKVPRVNFKNSWLYIYLSTRFSLHVPWYLDVPRQTRPSLPEDIICGVYPYIPDRRAGIMKYRSGNARAAPTRGALLYPREFPRSNLSLSLSSSFFPPRCWSRTLLCSSSAKWFIRLEWISRPRERTLERGRWPISCGDVTLIPSRRREIKRIDSRRHLRKRSVEGLKRFLVERAKVYILLCEFLEFSKNIRGRESSRWRDLNLFLKPLALSRGLG